MSSLTTADLSTVAALVDFVRGPGYVLQFSDREFTQFFGREIGVDIDDPKYANGGRSKGKRLRSFLELSDNALAARALKALWDARVAFLTDAQQVDPVASAQERYRNLLARMGTRVAGLAPLPPFGAGHRVVEAQSSHYPRRMFWAYMLHCRGGFFYTGHTENLEARIAQHQNGWLPGFTRDHLPVTLVWSEAFSSRIEALAAERRIKGWGRAKKLALIRGDWDEIGRLAKARGGSARDHPDREEKLGPESRSG